MSDSPFLPSDGAPPFAGLPVVEDTDNRKVIVLIPRGGMPKLGLGCAVSLFIPAAVLCLPFVLPNARVDAPWLLAGLLLLAIVVPIGLIYWPRTIRDTETKIALVEVQKHLSKLTTIQREILIMRLWQELSYKEIAE
ncbi:MAG: hypothetical protein IAG10_29980, partial [Planctomycetaceae bacterium]|nr:hypothetical protein [Planctomycetaceae bacterium]